MAEKPPQTQKMGKKKPTINTRHWQHENNWNHRTFLMGMQSGRATLE